MQNIINSKVQDEIVDIKQRSLFARLKRLFSTDVIVRNVGGKQLKIKDTDSVMYALDKNSLKDRFNRFRSTAYNAHSRDFALAYQSSRMDLFRDYDCIGPDTIIPLPDGSYPTIKELAEKYKDKPQERFHVFSYDHETDSIKLGNAYHPRKKGTQKAWKVTFDNDKFEVSTDDHLFLCRNGVYKKLKELSVGESMMPFYQKEFYGRGYRFIYNFSKKWQPEHRIVAEQFYRKVDKTEVVHHKNFKKNDNRPNNLQIMGKHAHAEYHMNLSTKIIWSPENKQKTLEKVRNSHGYKNRKFHKWNGERQGEKNPFFGKSHTIQSNELRSTSLKQALKDRNYYNEKNPNFRSELTVDVLKIKAVDYYKEKGKLDIFGLCEYIGCDYSLVKNRVSNWKTFKDNIISTLNHKIKSIEYIGEVDVYDLSVETYHNFATNNVFIHNCMDFDPIISSALDVYADECVTYNELGKILTVKSSDNNIKEILDNLFTDILNVPFNLWSWTRNMCKYGDFYLKLYISPEYGIYMVEPISSYNVERIENADPYNKRYVKFQIRPTDTSQAEVLESYQVAHFRLLSDSNFLPYGKCLASNSYIETEFGAKRINELIVGDKIWSFNIKDKTFELTSVKNICESGKKEILKISSRHNEICCSPEHPVLVFDKTKSTSQLIYKQAKEISMNDMLVISNNSYKKSKAVALNKTLLTENKHNGWQRNINDLPTTVDADFAEFFGFMIGDGWLGADINKVSFAAGTDQELNDRYTKLLEKYSGKSVTIVPARENGGEQRFVNCKLLSEFLYVNGFKGYACTKRIPEWVYELEEDLQLAFIKGLVNADGSIFTDKWNVNRYSIELNNKCLVEDIKTILNRLNIKCSNVKERRFEGMTEICGTSCHRNKSYYIYFYLDGMKKAQMEKYNYLPDKNLILSPIIKIEQIEDDETFDIQVESVNSNFIANGLIVHNSYIEGSRRIWKQLSLMEDAMLIHRIMRAPEKRIFYTDIGNIPPAEVDTFMEKLITKSKKVPYLDEKTGDYNLRFNLQNMVEDYYIPVRGGDSGTKIDTLSGMEWNGIDDIDYLRNKLLASLKIPKAFLNYDESAGGKSTLANEDLRFSRTIQRIQKILISELSKIAIIHLYAQGYRDEHLVDFDLELTNPSTIAEKEKIDIWSDKVSVASDMMDNKIFSTNWIYKHVFNMSDEDILQNKLEIVEDTKQKFRFTKIEEEGEDPAVKFEKIDVSSDSGGDSGGTEPSGGPDLGAGEPDLGGGGLPDLKGEPGGGEPPPKELKEQTNNVPNNPENRDQSGRKKADSVGFGNDPLGMEEFHRDENSYSEGKRKSKIKPNPKQTPLISPLKLEENTSKIRSTVQSYCEQLHNGTVNSLSKFLSKSQEEIKQELLNEGAPPKKSMLDESNIIE